jgi:hypothetical protein
MHMIQERRVPPLDYEKSGKKWIHMKETFPRLANCSLVLINMGIIAKDISHRTDRPSLSQQPNQQTKERLKAKHGDQFFLSLRAGTKGKTDWGGGEGRVS